MNRIVALIPAYEPDKKMIDLLEKLYEKRISIVVVNDGSDSSYNRLFQEATAYGTVLSSKRNKGKGAALKHGLNYIKEHFDDSDIVVTADADGQHKPRDIEKVAQAVASDSDALILGSRDFKGKVPVRSRLGNTITRWIYDTFTGQKIMDTQTGLRGFLVKWIPLMASIEGERYEYEMNVLMYCAKHSFPMKEIAIETVYLDGNKSSHFNTLRDSVRIYKEILKFSASSFLSFLLDYGLFSAFYFVFSLSGYTSGTLMSNVLARVISGTFNFTINRNVVFESKESPVKAGFKYALLCGGILCINTGLLTVITAMFSLNVFVAKILVEIIMFVLSFTVQRTIVFPLKKNTRNQFLIGKGASA